MTEGNCRRASATEKREASKSSWNGTGTPSAGLGSGVYSDPQVAAKLADQRAVFPRLKRHVKADSKTPAFP